LRRGRRIPRASRHRLRTPVVAVGQYDWAVLIDTHCHLYFDSFAADRAAVLARMREAGVLGAVIIGIDAESNEQARQTAQLDSGLYYAAGLHPTSGFPAELPASQGFDATDYLSPWLDSDSAPVAIGECGIDLHWDTNPLARQRQIFIAQLELGRQLDLPVIVHTREADGETREALESVPGARGVLHCFNGSPDLLKFALAANGRGDAWYISFAGNLTYKRAEELRQAARAVPLDRLLVETDSPFLAPQAHRGRRNEPAYVVHVAAELARLRELDRASLNEQLLANSRSCFGVDWK
jgi:TatD DNase family protein